MGVAVDDVFLTTKGTEITKCEPDEIAFPRPAHSGSPLHLLPPEAILHLPIKIQQSSLDNPFAGHSRRHSAEKWVRRAASPYLC
jgi:hypothetical protein